MAPWTPRQYLGFGRPIRGAANRHFRPATGSSGREFRFLGATFVETEQKIRPEPRSAPSKELIGAKRTPGAVPLNFTLPAARGAGIARRRLPAGAPQKAPWTSGNAARASATGRDGTGRRLVDLVRPAGGRTAGLST